MMPRLIKILGLIFLVMETAFFNCRGHMKNRGSIEVQDQVKVNPKNVLPQILSEICKSQISSQNIKYIYKFNSNQINRF